MAALTLTVGVTARASPEYPGLIQDRWALSYTPPCTLCHATLSGGTGTVVTYFGKQMQAFGLVALDDSSLAEALDRDRSTQTDSDGSGASDYDEIVSGEDPNRGPGPSTLLPEAPSYGCSVARGGAHPLVTAYHAAPDQRGARLLGAVVALIFAAAAWRHLRRRSDWTKL